MPSTHARSRSAKSSHLAWSRDRHALTPVFPELASKQSAPAFGGQSDRIIKFADTLRTVTDHEFRCRIDAIRKTENLDPIVARVGRAEGSLTVTQHAFPCVALARVTSHPVHGPSGSSTWIRWFRELATAGVPLRPRARPIGVDRIRQSQCLGRPRNRGNARRG